MVKLPLLSILLSRKRGSISKHSKLKENECEVGDTIDAFNKKVNKSGVCPTLTTRPEGFKTAILPVVGAMRGRNPEDPFDRTAGVPTEQRLEINEKVFVML